MFGTRYGPGAMPAGPLEHLRPDRRIRPLVADDPRLHRRDPTLGVAADLVGELDRMPLRMDAETLGPRERHLHGPADEPGHQRRLRLDRHVLLAAERAAVGDELHVEPVALDAEHRRTLPLIVEDALPLRVDLQ